MSFWFQASDARQSLVTARAFFALALACSLHAPNQALAQSVTTQGPNLANPTFESIDDNGVDVISGMFHIEAPSLSAGAGVNTFAPKLRWNGKLWSFDVPSMWADGNSRDFYINIASRMDELNYISGYGWQPLRGDGGWIYCYFFDEDAKVVQWCQYASKEGISAVFSGLSPLAFPNTDYYTALGNLNINSAGIVWPDGRKWEIINGLSNGGLVIRSNQGYHLAVSSGTTPAATIRIAKDDGTEIISAQMTVGTISVNTPGLNYDDRKQKNIWRPKSTTQTFADESGGIWSFQFNDNYNMIRVTRPGGLSALTLTYDDNHRVKTFNNGFGTWSYNYSSSSGNGTTTITNPQGLQRIVTYINRKGSIRTDRDELGRTTTYGIDVNGRITSITLPENNATHYVYDALASITSATKQPKPNSGLGSIETSAEYYSCSAPGTTRARCSQPRYVIDGRGSRTDYTYNDAGQVLTIDKPAGANGIRPQTRMVYAPMRVRVQKSDGTIVERDPISMLVSQSECRTQASCTGTLDEVLTTYDYGPATGPNNLWLRGVTVTADGVTQRTCYTYDGKGNVISETEPRANPGSC